MPNPFKYRLEISAFICGAVIMIYELLGSRIIAPYLGTSIYAWTSLIGIILLSLSAGYWYGGYLADHKPKIAILAKTILVASACITLTLYLETILLNWLQYLIISGFLALGTTTILANLILFAPASFFLGIVTPYAIKLKSEEMAQQLNSKAAKKSSVSASKSLSAALSLSAENPQTARLGRTVGNLYAISTFGSIIGTFASGYLLIPFFGTRLLVALIALILLILSAVLHPRNLKNIRTAPLFILVFVALLLFFCFKLAVNLDSAPSGTQGPSASNTLKTPVFADLDTPYNRIWIVEQEYDHKNVRWLKTNPFGFQSGIDLNDPAALVSPYMQFFTLHRYFNPQARQILMIGGGGLAYAKYHQQNDPQIGLDIVEIDPRLTEVAQQYFLYQPSPGINVINEDGRIYINRSTKKYDVIVLDAFTSIFSIPYPLTTIEAVQKYYDLLTPGGVLMANIISPLTPAKSQFLRAQYLTFTKIFPRVFLYQAEKADPSLPQGIILVAFKNPEATTINPHSATSPQSRITPPSLTQLPSLPYSDKLQNLVTQQINTDLPPLTDDHAPVDYYIDKLLY